jgi:anaphase-promoting complex subunit 2
MADLVTLAWSRVVTVFGDALRDRVNLERVDIKELQSNASLVKSLEAIRGGGLQPLLEDWLFGAIADLLGTALVPACWVRLADFEAVRARASKAECRAWVCEQWPDTIADTHDICGKIKDLVLIVFRNEPSKGVLLDRLSRLLHTHFFTCAPACFSDLLFLYFDAQFRAFHHVQSGARYEEEEEEEDEGFSAVEQANEVTMFEATCVQLRTLGWLSVVEESYSDVLFCRTQERILKVCKGEFDRPLLEPILQWVAEVVVPFIQLLAPSTGESDAHKTPARRKAASLVEKGQSSEALKSRLTFFAFERFAALRIGEMFDVIVDFPDSMSALKDMKQCLSRTNQHAELIRSLSAAFRKRLLHPGANTSDIIMQYISTIRALRILDPSGVTLEAVGGEVQAYLRERPDAVRCIVTSLTGDSNGELLEELEQSPDPGAQDGEDSDADEDRDGEGLEWVPDPVDADPTKTSRSRRTADIIGILVGMFDTKELFVHEYKALLADKLLAKTTYDTEQELGHLELLKLRFGEAALHYCDVMLKDMYVSKGVNGLIKEGLREDVSVTGDGRIKHPDPTAKPAHEVLEAVLLSEEFWPSLESESFQLPQEIRDAMEHYGRHYVKLKAPRALEWQPNLGQVELEVCLEDRTLNLVVSPIQASIIANFEREPVWTLQTLAEEMQCSQPEIRRQVNFWVNRMVIREIRDSEGVTYHLLETLTEQDAAFVHLHQQDDDYGAVTSDRSSSADVETIQQYIVGMLRSNTTATPLHRIHSMLSMFNSADFSYRCTSKELQAVLGGLVQTGKVELEDGLYKLSASLRV